MSTPSSLLNKKTLVTALYESVLKLDPRVQFRNPVMFVVYLSCLFCVVLWLVSLIEQSAQSAFIFSIACWLWFTLLFANFAEAIAEGQSRAQAASLKSLKKSVVAIKLAAIDRNAPQETIPAQHLRLGDLFLVTAEDIIPADGEVVMGVASVDESAITGESAPVIRESGGDFCSVTGGTRILSDWLIVRVTANPGESFLDKMIGMVEGASRKKTPNEIALTLLLVMLTLVFLTVIVSLLPLNWFIVEKAQGKGVISLVVLLALLVCLIPTTIGGLLSAIGVAGMHRLMKANVIATSGRAVETAGNIDVLLLDKTGTITYGNRQASDFYPAPGYQLKDIAQHAFFASYQDDTPEGRSIIVLAQQILSSQYPELLQQCPYPGSFTAIAFQAQTRMSGADIVSGQKTCCLRKGADQAIRQHIERNGGNYPAPMDKQILKIASEGATPLLVSVDNCLIGAIALRDIVKPNIRSRFESLRTMGIKTVMITGDNPLTAASIASEAGVDSYLAEATPEAKLALIREYQQKGQLVAMTGDGTNDAPALAQADVAVAMNSGTQAAKEASNMVDLDSDPTKLIDIVNTGKELLMTRGALTTFSIANDIAKYFAIIPAAFSIIFPPLAALNLMRLHSPESAILSAVIFNALIIILLIPVALKGVSRQADRAENILQTNLALYGLGGLITPFIGIKLIDYLITFLSFS